MIVAGATISPCGKFRYRLWRRWSVTGPALTFVMLNPSTADGTHDDPTIRKCVGFAKLAGYSGIEVLNLFAYRATDPAELRKVGLCLADAIGPENDAGLRLAATCAAASELPIVCAWGAHARGLNRVLDVAALLMCAGAELHALDFTADGIPRHPLMLPYSATLTPYKPL